MNLVDEEDRLSSHLQPLLRFADDFADFGNSFRHRRERDEFAVGVLGDQSAKRRFAGSWRSPEHHRGDASLLDCIAEGFARSEEMLLSYEFLKCARAHSRCQW